MIFSYLKFVTNCNSKNYPSSHPGLHCKTSKKLDKFINNYRQYKFKIKILRYNILYTFINESSKYLNCTPILLFGMALNVILYISSYLNKFSLGRYKYSIINNYITYSISRKHNYV